MTTSYNLKSPSVKRILTEAKELKDPTDLFYAQPLEENMFEWHFTVRGPDDTPFAGGIYHGRILLPTEYPFKPPSIILLTPNGRFEVNKKICLSISAYHPEYWRPSWSIRTVLLALISFLPTDGRGTIGSLEYPDEERVKLAKRSPDWACPTCGPANRDVLLPVGSSSPDSTAPSQDDAEAIAQIAFKGAPNKEEKTEASSGEPKADAPESKCDISSQPDRHSEHLENIPTPPSNLQEPLTAPAATDDASTAQPQVIIRTVQQSHSVGELSLTFLIWAVAAAILALLLRKFSRL